jgi:hypothetical protein
MARKRQVIPVTVEPVPKGRVYPVSPNDVKDFIHSEHPDDVVGLTE